ncbi:MAG: DNA endonuclease SmrA [bacterium]
MQSEQDESFGDLFGEVDALSKEDRVLLKKSQLPDPGLKARRLAAEEGAAKASPDGLSSVEHIPLVKPHDILSFRRDGVQHGVFRKLRLGHYPIESRIDLHRMTFDQARKRVGIFISDCVKAEIRSALITHGRGENSKTPALLKSSVNRWLRETDAVMAFHSAQPNHGGSGSTYVLFRKGQSQKMKNRERFGGRS